MADKYQIQNTGTQYVKAINQATPKKGTKVVKTGDLRK